jgi:hypothetical protein
MRKFLILILIFTSFVIHSQDSGKQISIEYEDLSIREILQLIEAQSEYQFFYLDEWLGNELRSGRYRNTTLQDLLDELFNDTLLNYYIRKDHKVILTENLLIYDHLPTGFFNESITSETIVNEPEIRPSENLDSPVFFDTSQNETVETIRIGREERNRSKSVFTLSGTILNETTGGPAADVTLSIENIRMGTITNENGFYSLSLPSGVHILSISSLGFQNQTKRLLLYNDGVLDFTMKESVEGLDEVVITANVDQTLKDTGTGITRVDVPKIKNIPLVLGERDIFKVAALTPGISSAGEGAGGYNVRGGDVDQNLILLDNGVIYNPMHFFGIFSAINPFTTDDVTIYKGHIPPKYGGRLSSVFDIKTKDANTSKLSGEASIGPVTSNLTLEVPLVENKAAILVGGRGTYSDLILKNLDEEELRKSKASFYDVILKYNHQLNPTNKIRSSVYYSSDVFSITSDSLFTYRNKLITLNWSHEFNEKSVGNLNLATSVYDFQIDFDGQSNRNFELEYKLNEYGLKYDLEYELREKHRLTFGISGKLYSTSPARIIPKGEASNILARTPNDEKATEAALYVSDRFKINEKITGEAGIRLSMFAFLGAATQKIYEEDRPKNESNVLEIKTYGSGDFIKTYLAPEFRFSTSYLIKPDLSVKGSVNTTYQYIHRLSTNTTSSPVDTWKLSDLNIKPQSAIQYSIGLYKNLNDFNISLEGYYKNYKDVLDYKVGSELLVNDNLEQEVLQGLGKSYGIEFLITKVKGKLNGSFGYTYSRSMLQFESDFPEEQINNGAYFPSNYDKPHDLSVNALYKLTQRYSFSANFVYQTGRPVTVPVGNFILNGSEYLLFSDRNEFRIPDYYRLDFSFNIEGNHKIKKLAHSFWNISVYNVLGRNNPYSVFFVTENNEIKAYKTSIFSVPIPTITYNLKF